MAGFSPLVGEGIRENTDVDPSVTRTVVPRPGYHSESINETREMGLSVTPTVPRRPSYYMDESVNEIREKGLSVTPTVPRRLSYRMGQVLRSLGNLRIEKSWIEPLLHGKTKEGGNATVQQARLRQGWAQAKDVAVKQLRLDESIDDDRAVALIVHEVGLVKKLDHENIVKVIGFVENLEEGTLWIIFPWQVNGNLREFVRSENWEFPERSSLIDDVARGLAYLHQLEPPVCHGDLKSLNILVNTQNRAVITDFGSARRILLSQGQTHAGRMPERTSTEHMGFKSLHVEVTASGFMITGPAWTIRWAAPELLNGGFPTLATDVWAFGWICWEVLTGKYPFGEEKDVAVVLKIMKGDIPSNMNSQDLRRIPDFSGIPDIEEESHLNDMTALGELMMRCWSLDPNERPDIEQCRESIQWMRWRVPTSRVHKKDCTARQQIMRAAEPKYTERTRRPGYVSFL